MCVRACVPLLRDTVWSRCQALGVHGVRSLAVYQHEVSPCPSPWECHRTASTRPKENYIYSFRVSKSRVSAFFCPFPSRVCHVTSAKMLQDIFCGLSQHFGPPSPPPRRVHNLRHDTLAVVRRQSICQASSVLH